MRPLKNLLLIVLLLFCLLPQIAYATPGEARRDARNVAIAYGEHVYTQNGREWVYADSRLHIAVRRETLTGGGTLTYVDVTRVGDGKLVGSWVGTTTLVYVPGAWETYLHNLALGIPPK